MTFELFQTRCEQLGRGDDMTAQLVPSLKVFMAKPDTKAACTEIEAMRRSAANKAKELSDLEIKRAALPAR